jgi:glycosyltransferase involved in cell wall biosynthesis
MKHDIKIIYLWAEITGYVQGVLHELSKHVNSINVVHWDKKRTNSTQYKVLDNTSICFHARSKTNDGQIQNLLNQINPNIIVVSGWMDKGYIKSCRKYKRQNPKVKIVAGIDDQWKGSFRQYLGTIYFYFFYKKIFDYMWVSGAEQYNYARFFGYKSNEIINYLYSGSYGDKQTSKSVSRKFIYIGRLMKSKGVDLLIEAHKSLTESERNKFPLHIYGSGELVNDVKESCDKYLYYHGWANTEDFLSIMKVGGIGVMPSRKEAWGVSIHEYTQFGLPILISDSCGSKNELCIPGYNGFIFNSSSSKSLANAFRKFIYSDSEELEIMAMNSLKIGSRINVELSAASLLSTIHQNNYDTRF